MPRDWPDSNERQPGRWRRAARAVEALLVVALLVAAAAASFARSTQPVPPRGTDFVCTPIAVYDGDGPIWCAEGPRIRLAGVNARELDGTCRPRARCVATSGIAARDILVALLGAPTGMAATGHVRVTAPPLVCRSYGPERYRRTLARCTGKHGDLATALVTSGAVAE